MGRYREIVHHLQDQQLSSWSLNKLWQLLKYWGQYHGLLIIADGQTMPFFRTPHKPVILALARIDPEKDLTTFIKAFEECRSFK
ncbi:sucrose-phosphate synthase [Artemisia annua]|uniref:Sucrose-phosphate synthase n=1 Tax=Artemisia annua TaxID=35608 RepID=A0A2U1LRX2_ARTAN|nr:sucrose-phosphate synthase [Artemisia annua]